MTLLLDADGAFQSAIAIADETAVDDGNADEEEV